MVDNNQPTVPVLNGAYSTVWASDSYAMFAGSGTGIYKVGARACGIDFKASNSNAIYGSSNTVQPPTITLIPQIRY